jgi:hypothetical protein
MTYNTTSVVTVTLGEYGHHHSSCNKIMWWYSNFNGRTWRRWERYGKLRREKQTTIHPSKLEREMCRALRGRFRIIFSRLLVCISIYRAILVIIFSYALFGPFVWSGSWSYFSVNNEYCGFGGFNGFFFDLHKKHVKKRLQNQQLLEESKYVFRQ